MLLRVTTMATLSLISLATTADAGMAPRAPWRSYPASSLCMDADLPTLMLAGTDGASAASFELAAEDVRRCFALDLPEPGVVLLGAAFAGATAEPRLEVHGCAQPGSVLTLLATPGERVLRTTGPQRLVACLGVQAPGTHPAAGILRVGFDRPGKKKQIEVEPEGSAQPSWPEPDLCRALAYGPGDDHGDLPLCASRIGLGSARDGRLDGELDRDVFAFELDRLSTVAFELAAAGELAVELLDARGHRLAWLSAGAGMRTKDLAAGVYFLAVGTAEGVVSGEERYRLALDRR